MASKINSPQIEKMALGGLFKFPELVHELPHLKDSLFYFKTHKNVFTLIRLASDSQENINHTLIANKFVSLGFSTPEGISSIADYLEDLSEIRSTKEAVVEAFIELQSMLTRREFEAVGEKIIEKANKITGDPDKVIAEMDKIYNEKISLFEISHEPHDLFSDMEDIVEEAGNNPVENFGLVTPWPTFNKMYDGAAFKEITLFASRSGHGKTTALSALAFHAANINAGKFDTLILDTEVYTKKYQLRLCAALCGVPYHYLATGKWRKSAAMTEKVRAAWKKIKGYKLDHLHVKNMPINEIRSLARRWYYSKGERERKCVIIYDYLKLTGEATSDSNREHQILGEKTNILKDLAEELNAAMLSAAQLNRTAEKGRGKWSEVANDQSTIGSSDKIIHLVGNAYIFKKKDVEELARDGEANGTHMLINIKPRDLGESGVDNEWVKVVKTNADGVEETKFEKNYISFNVINFEVTEVGDLNFIMEQNRLRDLEIQDGVAGDDDLL